jgi:GrpB-like predicted nucleotidyltransferase (UPF0157 family)
MADQLVEIVEFDPAWADRFAAERERVGAVLGPWLAAPVEHVGSTSVPGLAAKPVVDMLAPVRALEAARAAVEPLEDDGWVFWSEDPCWTYRLWFLRPRPQQRTHHLHVIEAGDPHASALLAFRDALRADAELRQAYADLKRTAARENPSNRNAYTNRKADFVERVLRRAGVNVPARDPLPE